MFTPDWNSGFIAGVITTILALCAGLYVGSFVYYLVIFPKRYNLTAQSPTGSQTTSSAHPMATTSYAANPAFQSTPLAPARQTRTRKRWWFLPLLLLIGLILLCSGSGWTAYMLQWGPFAPAVSQVAPLITPQVVQPIVVSCANGSEIATYDFKKGLPDLATLTATECSGVDTEASLEPGENYIVLQETLGDLEDGTGEKPNDDKQVNATNWGNNINVFAYQDLPQSKTIDRSDLEDSPILIIKVPDGWDFSQVLTVVIDNMLASHPNSHVYWKVDSNAILPSKYDV